MINTYKSAGVDIEAGDELVKRIKKNVRSTFSPAVISEIGGFGGMFSAKFDSYSDPVLVSSVDGVGTKLRAAIMSNIHDTVGQDLVNHCVNDILACGAKPLFFLDYFACGKLDVEIGTSVIQGLAKACKENNLSLIAGESAEMPGIYSDEDYDLAGTIVGIVDRKKILTGSKVKKDDVLIGIPSSGMHTNGYSLARKVLLDKYKIHDHVEKLGCTISEELLKIHRSYLGLVYPLIEQDKVHALSHITGGGIVGNTIRVIPDGLSLAVDWNSWEWLPVFKLIKELGNVPVEDMQRTFNLGIGFIIIADKANEDYITKYLSDKGEKPVLLGKVQ